MSEINKLFNLIAKLKNFVNRATGYVSIVNTFLIILTFKKLYDIQISAYLIIMLGIIILISLGIFDYKYILKYEYEHTNKVNDIKMDLLEIKNLIKK